MVAGIVAVEPAQNRCLRETPLDAKSAGRNIARTKSLLYGCKVDAKESTHLLGRKNVCTGIFGRDTVAGVQLDVDEVGDKVLLRPTGRTHNFFETRSCSRRHSNEESNAFISHLLKLVEIAIASICYHPPMDATRRTTRFGFQLESEHAHDPVGVAQRAEELGFDVMLLSDHVGPGISPLVTLAAMAQATTRIRLGTYVLNNDMRNPVQLAWEAVTLDRLSGGRFELGIGAGHTPHEYDHVGLQQDRPQVRKARLAESVEILRQLFDGELVDFEGEHYRIHGAQLDRSVQQRLPIMVAGNGAALLGHAGAHADIIGLQGLGMTREDGHSHRAKWDPARLDLQVEQIRVGAGESPRSLEINALVQVAEVTDDRDATYAEIATRIEGLTVEHAAQTPYLLVGTIDEIVDQIIGHRERWGITYFGVRTLDEFGPVIAALRAQESTESP